MQMVLSHCFHIFPAGVCHLFFIQASILRFDSSILIPGTSTPLIYPYFFVNLETQGVGGVLKWIVIILIAFIAVGYLFFGLDKLGMNKKDSEK